MVFRLFRLHESPAGFYGCGLMGGYSDAALRTACKQNRDSVEDSNIRFALYRSIIHYFV